MMKRQIKCAWRLGIAASLLAVTGAASAIEVTLVAQEFNKPMPDGTVVTMWGYARQGEAPTVPGPVIRVPAGDSLTLHVTNNLPQAINGGFVPTSLVVPGQAGPLTPVMFTDTSGRQRVRSFTAEATSTQTVTYNWANPTPGTYIYHSGTNPQVQVQMGLYGAIVVEAGTDTAYTGVTYAKDLTLIYSEVDPALHAAVAAGTYGNAAIPNAMTSTLDYSPKYFLINGESFVQGATLPLATAAAGSATLLRLVNAGLQTRVPQLQGLDMQVVAEDGKPYQYPKTQYTAFLPALKTVDALIVPTADGDLPFYDRRLGLTNFASSPGGMFRLLRTGGSPIAQADGYNISEDTILTVPAPGVLGNDFTPGGALSASVLTQPINGVLNFSADGSFTYTPNPNFFGADSFTYQASAGGVNSPAATVSITVNAVNDPPVAVTDNLNAAANAATVLDVMANDFDPEGSGITLFAVDNPSANGGTVSITGNTVTYTPLGGFTGADTFQYVISDSDGLMGIGTVNLTVQ